MATFDDLWNNHPTSGVGPYPYDSLPCRQPNGQPWYLHQCAPRLSVCLTRSGISLAKFSGGWCLRHDKQHAKAAYPLAYYLMHHKDTPWPEVIKNNAQRNLINSSQFLIRKGIVFFSNFWGTNNQDDHIDLWNGTRMTYGDNNYFSRSQEVWFWDYY